MNGSSRPAPQLAKPVLTARVLDEADCEDWAMAVLMQEADWCRRHPQAPFFTLGMAAYLDGAGPAVRYYQPDQRERNNALIERCFKDLLERVAIGLQQLLEAPVRLVHRAAALPGFHIYLPHEAFSEPVASVHRDLQYRQAFPGVEPRANEVFSFTLPLCHPERSGLLRWAECHDSASLRAPDGVPVKPDFHSYQPGEIVVHDGLSVHQAILGCDGATPRITLQGHGLWVDESYLLYW